MVPYQNLFYIDKLFDAAEKGLQAALVPEGRRAQ